ncbi:MAG TPA: amino acid ABC transporter substrate-binding protein [Acetobacteraceae bacterium]|nr:amino acid ABC transporter substrate-binding protein [Acetobacteraceae bacterium]
MKALALAAGIALGCVVAGTASADDLYGTLKKIRDSGTITIGRSENSVPFSYTGSDGNPVGYSIELCSHIVDAVKQELKLDKLQVRYVTIMGTTLIPLLVNGTIDMACSTTTHTLARQRQVDFLPTMYITGNQLLVRKDSGIHEVEDLKGKRVAVNQGTTNEKIIKAIDAQEHLGITFLDTEDQPRGWLAFESGRVDCYVTDAIVEHGLISKAAHPEQYEVVGRLLSFDPYSVVVRRDDSAFRLVGVRTIAHLIKSGDMFKLYDKWIGPIAGPMNPELKYVLQGEAYPD